MKIALCLSGQPRYVDECVPYIQRCLLDGNDVDVFMHVWFSEKDTGSPFLSSIPHQDGRVGWVHPETETILRTLKPKAITLEPQITFDVSGLPYAPTAIPQHVASQFYSMMACYKLKEEYSIANNIKYDLVIKSRYDFYIGDRVNMSKLNEIAKLGKIASPYKWQMQRMTMILGLGDYTLCSDFGAGNEESMRAFMNVYPRMREVGQKIHPPYVENYIGYVVRVMEKIEPEPYDIDIEIYHRLK
jgi:hypothetical protein